MLIQHIIPDYISAGIRRIKVLVIFQDDHIRYAQLSVRRKNIHHIDLLLSDRFIFQANIHVHRIFKLEPVGLAQSVVAIFPLEEIILRSKSQLTRRPL